MAKFTIRWTSYNHVYPLPLTEKLYEAYKKKQLDLPTINFNFIETFYPKLIVIFIGFLAVCYNTSISTRNEGGLYLINYVVIFIAFFVSINFVMSAISYIESYKRTKKYIDNLNEILYYSESYEEFCIVMCDIDNRYYLQINRNNSIQE